MGSYLARHRKWVGLALGVLIIVTGVITALRALKGSNDFDAYYAAGRAVLERIDPYADPDEKAVSLIPKGTFLYPPFAAIFFSLFAVFPLGAAAFVWNVFNFALLAVIVFAARGLLSSSDTAWIPRIKQIPLWEKYLLAVMSAGILFDNISMAQINILVLALTLSGVWLIEQKKGLWGGVCIAFAVALKLTPALFIFYVILRRRWSGIAGFVLGLLLSFFLIPAAIFGYDQNIKYHQNWMDRLSGSSNQWERGFTADAYPNLLNPNPEKYAEEEEAFKAYLEGYLTAKNQSVTAVLHRLLLKDRHQYANAQTYPVYVARRYNSLPVLFGGFPIHQLSAAAKIIQLTLLSLGIIVANKVLRASGGVSAAISILLLTMTLVTPWARSHQFVSLLFPMAWLVTLQGRGAAGEENAFRRSYGRLSAWILIVLPLAAALYLLQALPLAKAAGAGMGSNLALWGLAVAASLQISISSNRKNLKVSG